MPIAAASIAQQAARFMELAPISSFGDDSPLAQDMADQYPIARRTCLEACDWSFASTVATLPPRAPGSYAADADLPWSFALPADCVRVMQVADDWVRWRIDGRLLRADAPGPLAVRYTADITNETSMPTAFQTAVALQLAALLSPRWVGAETKTQGLEARASQALKNAMRNDARSASLERYDGRSGDADWVDGAIGGGSRWPLASRYVGTPSVVKVIAQSPVAVVPLPDQSTNTDYVAIYEAAK